MRSLFIKIFLWFGVAMVLANMAAFVTGVLIQRSSQRPRFNPFTSSFGILAQTAVDTLERQNTEAVKSYFDRLENASRVRAAILNEQDEEISGRALPPGTRELAERAKRESGPLFEGPTRGQPNIVAQAVVGPSGARYVVVGELPAPDFPIPPRPGEPGSIFFGLWLAGRTFLPLLLIGSLFCYWLAGHLAKPITELRGATQSLADGNLGTRVETKLLKRRDEIGYLGRDFNVMASRIESLVDAQRRLLTDISHELRSPLARHGVALGLARKRTDVQVKPELDRIALEAERINAMIGQVLTLSQLESGANGFENLKIDLLSLVREIADDADFEARSRGCAVHLLISESCVVTGAPLLLRSAVENVVRNAIRYTTPGTAVEISLCFEPVEEKGYAVITVRDHGVGVPEEKIDAIFRPFYRVEDARDRKTGGTGLGLAIADRAVRAHAGEINARNAEDGGLIIEIKIPATRTNPHAAGSTSSAA